MFFGISLSTSLNGALLFTPVRYQAGSRFELWRSDGTAAGTSLVKAFPNTNADLTFTDNYVVHNNQLFFRLESAEGLELWQSDGSEAGTQKVMLVTSDLAGFSDEQLGIKAINSQIFFTAADTGHGAELWTAPALSALEQWLILTLFIR
jgi:ELWxxDGT repeat protein